MRTACGEVKVVSSVLSLLALVWAAVQFRSVADSRRKARTQVQALQRDGFSIDYIFKGNIYVLFDHTRKKIAFVFRDKSHVHDYRDIEGVTRYWLGFPGFKLRNTMVFALPDKKIRCRNLSSRQAEYWQRRAVELITA